MRFRKRERQPVGLAPDPHFEAQLRAAADMAISAAWRGVAESWIWEPGDVATVDVEDALGSLHEHFGIVAVPPEKVAATLRERFELRACGPEFSTDAYDARWTREAA